ncbi:MAG: hypothetical protein AB8G86_02630 [Saprospiraceae bacterium]
MTKNIRTEIENYIDDWYWNVDSHKHALDLGIFLFSFMYYLDDQDMSTRTREKHEGNIWLIGKFECDYGYRDTFDFKNLARGISYDIEFKRKVSSSKSAVQSYGATWNKLNRYIKNKKHETYWEELKEVINDLGVVNDIWDFTILIKQSSVKNHELKKELLAYADIIKDNYVEYEECESKEAYNKEILKVWQATEDVFQIFNEKVDHPNKAIILEKAQELTTVFYELVNN